MMKMNLKKMVIAAAMAAFMVYAPAMAEEEGVIIEESFEMEKTAAVETETAAEVELFAIEIEAAQTGKSFFFETEEVVITATAADATAQRAEGENLSFVNFAM